MANSNENEPLSQGISIGSVTSDGSILPATYITRKSKILGAYLINGADVAADDANYATITIRSGSQVIATLDTRSAHQGALSANHGASFSVDPAQSVRAGGETLTIQYNEIGTVGLTNAVIVLNYFPV